MTKTPEQLFSEFKNVLSIVGYDIQANEYDKLKIDKPGRKQLIRAMGKSWAEIKSLACPIQEATKSQLLLQQNKKLLEALDNEKNKTKQIIDSCLEEIAKVNFRTFPIPLPEKSKENLEFHIMRSDAQVGQKINPASVQNLSKYDIDIYKKRLGALLERILVFKEQDKNYLGLNKLVIHHLGDQVEGESIYKGQSFYLCASLFDQLFISCEQEASWLLTLSQYFSEIEVYCVDGNHGRIGQKGDHHGQTNFDRIFYVFLKKLCEKQSNIKIYISESPSMLVQHGDFVFSLNHGNAAKSWQGIPFYGLERMQRRLPDLYGMIIHYGLYGHHHTPVNVQDRLLINGCFPGGSDLSINQMSLGGVPSQKIFYFHSKKGINRESNLYLDEPVKLKKDKNNIFTAYR
jgi:hypothetical protein